MARYLLRTLVLGALCFGCAHDAGVKKAGKIYESGEVTTDVKRFLDRTSPPGVEEKYVIGIGDRLDVVFFLHRDLTTLGLLVRSDGCITLPYVGDVAAAGLTPMQLDSTLTARFSEVLREPDLAVIVANPAQKLVYVLGQVKMPGAVQFENKLSLLQALAVAKGFDRGAKTKHVVLIRRDGLDGIVGVEINVASITEGKNLADDIWLRNYDIVYVPKTRLQSAAEFMDILNDVVFAPTDMVLRGWQVQVMWEHVQYLRSGEE